jgi:RNA polymerase sigma-70 factor (ECF subfamily)
VQDAFSRYLGLAPSRSAAIDRPGAYLRRIGRNLLRDRAKISARRSAQLHVADAERLAGPDQQALLETRDMLRRLEAAMLKLKPQTREIFMAHRLDGMSYAEISARTGLSIKGVEKQMSKAIARIDRLLDRG